MTLCGFSELEEDKGLSGNWALSGQKIGHMQAAEAGIVKGSGPKLGRVCDRVTCYRFKIAVTRRFDGNEPVYICIGMMYKIETKGTT
jgi:hypothetical protein